MNFVLGIKTEMTQLYDEDGKVLPVTVINIANNVICGVKTEEKDGYKAIVIGMDKKKHPTKAEIGKFLSIGYVPRYLSEFRVSSVDGYTVGEQVNIEKFDKKVLIDVTARSKGKGFQGAVKKYHFAGGPKTHGQSDRHRAVGSIGAGTTPGRVLKGKKMPGRMGGEIKTIKKAQIVEIDKTNGLIVIKGAVPGPRGGFVKISISNE